MRPIDRRQFFQDSAAMAAGLSLVGAAAGSAQAEDDDAPAKPVSANDAIRLAVIGVRGRGMEHIGGFTNLNDVRITTICDVDKNEIGKAQTRLTAKYGSEAKYYQDLRRVFDDKDIDAVSIATPNHWHALAAIWALQAGKDVYVEKPVSHNVSEGRRIVEATRKTGKICQTGTQCRSNKGIQDAIAFLRSGKLGKIYMAKGLCYKWRSSIGHKDDASVPEGLDYNLWVGPAEMKPYNANRLHYNWHWFWNTGNGDLGNQGIHQMDIARWGLGKNEFPKTVQSSGGRFGYKDDGETPNTELVAMEFDDAMLQFEVRGLPTNDESQARIGVIFCGTEGVLVITSYTSWHSYFVDAKGKETKGPSGSGGGDHFANFVKAVKARDPKLQNAEIEEGHLSSAYCHLGNIAYRLGRKLHINPSSESFVNDSEADAMLTREYRAPFIVPSHV
ncbi:MAG TPA: Gfo/Idh/MocA family oxidoreductase [Isosphaeraceae bacterium]|jgi:predicted dehydrogenase|nr:Gfo/Idh/MocA family oxidoreductase [Isosphaeraceae bacterium]